jgi:hypothetical protein
VRVGRAVDDHLPLVHHLPVELPRKVELVVNIGGDRPREAPQTSLLLRADEVIQ